MAFGKQGQASSPREFRVLPMKKPSIQNILVPIDFSKMSIDAIGTAQYLADRSDAAIHLTHVHQFRYPGAFMGPVFSARELGRTVKNIASKSGLSSRDRTQLRTGAAPFDEICRLAQEIRADLIVMPTHGYTGLEHVFIGSTTERVVQHSPCPVFVVREKKRPSKIKRRFSIKTILVPVDFSDCSREGLRHAVGFAREFRAKIILLHATYLGYVYSSEGTAIYDVPA